MKTFNDYINENIEVNESVFDDIKFQVGEKAICINNDSDDLRLQQLLVTIINIVRDKKNGDIYYMIWNENDFRGYFTELGIQDNPTMGDEYWIYKKGVDNKKSCFWSEVNGTDLISDEPEENNFEEWMDEGYGYNISYFDEGEASDYDGYTDYDTDISSYYVDDNDNEMNYHDTKV